MILEFLEIEALLLANLVISPKDMIQDEEVKDDAYLVNKKNLFFSEYIDYDWFEETYE